MPTIDTTNPATDVVITQHPQMSAAQMGEAIASCQEAFVAWSQRPVAERAVVLAGMGQALTERKDDLAAMMTREMGKLLSQSKQEVDLCAGICAYAAEQGPTVLASEERELQKGQRGYISYAPIGLVYGIQPWNFPAYQVVRYAAASLMAGNGVLLKHASSCVGSGKLLAEIFEAGGLPNGLFTVLVIDHDQSD
jgi:succinate-semialdehyde dehydrogenase / glutarate-semialdehyde dehydrogenase